MNIDTYQHGTTKLFTGQILAAGYSDTDDGHTELELILSGKHLALVFRVDGVRTVQSVPVQQLAEQWAAQIVDRAESAAN